MQININHNQPLEQPVIPRAPMANRQNFCERVVGNLRALAEHVGRTMQNAIIDVIQAHQLMHQEIQQQQQRRLLQDFLREQNLNLLAHNIALDRNLLWALPPHQVRVLLINFR